MLEFICESEHHVGDRVVQYMDGLSSGYGLDSSGRKVCYKCCAITDRETMIRDGKCLLYYDGREIMNWPGSLRFAVSRVNETRVSAFGQPIRQYAVYFKGPDNHRWLLVVKGDSMVGTARRLKYIYGVVR